MPVTKYYPFLDGMRALAVLLVMLDHSYDFYWRYVPRYTDVTISPVYAFFSGMGREGVGLFFMLSGFLITGVMIHDFAKPIDLKRFYIRRFLKIVPLFVVVVALVYLAAKSLGIYKEYNDAQYLVPFFFLQDFFPTHPILQPAWSLTVEMEFYLLYPLIAILIFRLIKNVEARRWFLLASVLFLAVLSVAFRHGHQTWGIPYVAFFYYADAILLGCALKLLEPYFPTLSTVPRVIFTSACVVAAFFILRFSTIIVDRKLTMDSWDNPLCTSLIFILIFFAAYYRFALLNFILENPLARFLGRISYAFYLWHYPLRYILVYFGPHPFVGFTSSLTCLWIVTVVLAAIATYTIERYFLNLRLKFAS